MKLSVKGYLLIALFNFLFLNTQAQEHLSAVKGVSGMTWERNYHVTIADVFMPVKHPEQIQKLCFWANPAFGTEFGFRVLQDFDGNYELESFRSVEGIWNSDDYLNPNRNSTVERTTKKGSEDDFKILIQLFDAALSTVKPHASYGLDGTRYFFDNNSLSGSIWFPKSGAMKELVDICVGIYKSEDKKRFKLQNQDIKRINLLIEQITNKE